MRCIIDVLIVLWDEHEVVSCFLPEHLMKSIGTIIGFFCMFLVSCNSLSAKEWRGIEPLRSSRSEVEHLLGAPVKNTMLNTYLYDLKDEHVFIQFS